MDDRPGKRQRLMMNIPDGFQTKSKTPVKARRPVISAPVFQSGFGKSPAVPTIKPAPKPQLDPLLFSTSVSHAALNSPDVPLTKHPAKPKSKVLSEFAPAAPASPTRQRNKPKSKVFSLPAFALPTPFDSPPPPALRTKPKPKLQQLSALTGSSPAQSKSLRVLAPPPIPLLPLPTKDDSPSTLKSLPVPIPIPEVKKTPLRTINTTRVALVTDLSTENGSAEVASIFLRNHFHSPSASSSDTPGNEFVRRGLDLSPHKSSAYRGPAFMRNGLASQASIFLSHSRTSLSLWTKEISRHSSFNPDMRLRIKEIISSPPHPVISLCRVLPRNSSDTPPTPSPESPALTQFPFPFPRKRQEEEVVKVLFSRMKETMEVGSEVWVWQPWFKAGGNVDGGETLICERFLMR